VGLEIKLKVAGKEVAPDQFRNSLEAKVYEHLRQRIADKLSGVTCPEHGTAPHVVIEGDDMKSLKWKVFGCCEKVREEALKAWQT